MNGRIKGWLRSPNLLARKPGIGWTMFIVGILVFALLAINLVVKGPLIAVDTSIANSLHNTALNMSSGLLNFIKSGWDLGNEVVIGLAVIMGVYFIVRRYWQEFWMGLSGAGVAPLIFLGLSHLFNRHRPEFAVNVASNPTGPGFPSGHTLVAVTLYGLIAYLLLPTISSRFVKWGIVIVALLIILFIGFSRVFTGGHYLTDVLAGYAVGLAWAGISYMAIEKYFVHRHKRQMENEKIEAKV